MHLTQLAREYGDKPAVITGESGESLSYAELERQSNKVAHLLRSRGLRPGDHVAVLMDRLHRSQGWNRWRARPLR
jgi:acyl-CoA synthetase (AMP-forming)/AMP-acid ligase II